MKELRREIPGFEGIYSISTDGCVYSESRIVVRSNNSKMHIRAKKLKPYFQNSNAEQPSFYLSKDGKKYGFSLSTLMKITYPENSKNIDNILGEYWVFTDDSLLFSVSSEGRIKRNSENCKLHDIEYIEPERLVSTFYIDNTLSVHLTKNNKTINKTVARLVYESFNGVLDSSVIVYNINGDRSDNRLVNLGVKKKNNRWANQYK